MCADRSAAALAAALSRAATGAVGGLTELLRGFAAPPADGGEGSAASTRSSLSSSASARASAGARARGAEWRRALEDLVGRALGGWAGMIDGLRQPGGAPRAVAALLAKLARLARGDGGESARGMARG